MNPAPVLLCPSAQTRTPGSHFHGVVDAGSGRIAYLKVPVPVTEEILASTAPLIPTEVLRFSAACHGEGCGHFSHSACTLVDRLVQTLPETSSSLPACAIRPTCRWFSQQGKQACMRCDTIVTDGFTRQGQMAQLATPPALGQTINGS